MATPYKTQNSYTVEIKPFPSYESVQITEYLEENFPGFNILKLCKLLNIDQDALTKIFIDPTINFHKEGSSIGGYYSLDNKTIGINPLLLLQGEEALAQVLYHESLHAGFILNEKGERIPGIKDEGLVETLTIKRMIETYGYIPVQSGYQNIVNELHQYFSDFSDKEILEQISDNNINTLDAMLEKIVLWPLIKSENIYNLTPEKIRSDLQSKWLFIRKYFNRLINDVSRRDVNPFEKAIMAADEYKFNNLMNRAAELLIDSNGIDEVFIELSWDAPNLTKDEILKRLGKSDKFKYILRYLSFGQESSNTENAERYKYFSKEFYSKLNKFVAQASYKL